MNYEHTIIVALIVFPLIAFLFTLPYIIYNYHRYGAISAIRTIIIYSFILYLICAYFLIILPLPSPSYVATLTTPKMQLLPFNFINDFISKSGFILNDFSTYLPALKSQAFYQPVFNIVLTIPFGIYLHYYYHCNLLKTIIYSFLLSLFFELTQLTGLYFLYPRSYRLFDVDDLFFNTLGGLCGYYVGNIFIKLLPSKETIDLNSYEKSKVVSGVRKLVAALIDYFIFIIICFIFKYFHLCNFLMLIIILSFIYYTILPIIFHNATIGNHIVNIKVIAENNHQFNVFISLVCHDILFVIIPFTLIYFVVNYSNIGLILMLIYFIYLLIAFFKLLLNKKLLYEKKMQTKIVSTLKIND
jgi:glycopeptide antibiotics resistance protein